MNSVLRDVLIGTIGSVIGALIVFLSTSGVRFTKAASQRATERKNSERKRWHNGTPSDRQEITNNYLFGILKNMLLGNFFFAIPTVFQPLLVGDYFGALNIFFGIGAALGAAFFLRGLGLSIRYVSLRRT